MIMILHSSIYIAQWYICLYYLHVICPYIHSPFELIYQLSKRIDFFYKFNFTEYKPPLCKIMFVMDTVAGHNTPISMSTEAANGAA